MDRYRLEYEIKKNGMTVEDFCKAVGMSKSAYYRKLKGISEFTQSEIMKTMTLLNIKNPTAIFFNEEVS